MESGHTVYGTEFCQTFTATTYTLSADPYDTFVANFLAETLTWTPDEPANWVSQKTKPVVDYMYPRKLKKTLTREYTNADSTKKTVVRTGTIDLPAKNTV